MKIDAEFVIHDLPIQLAQQAVKVVVDHEDDDSAMPSELRSVTA